MELDAMLNAFLHDYYVYEKTDLNGLKIGGYEFGSGGSVGGFMCDLVFEHLKKTFGRDKLIEICLEKRKYESFLYSTEGHKLYSTIDEINSLLNNKINELVKNAVKELKELPIKLEKERLESIPKDSIVHPTKLKEIYFQLIKYNFDSENNSFDFNGIKLWVEDNTLGYIHLYVKYKNEEYIKYHDEARYADYLFEFYIKTNGFTEELKDA